MSLQWKGVFPAITTKFTAEGELDLAGFSANVKEQLAAGVNGIVLGGSLGEASVLNTAEKELLVKTTLEITGDKVPVILNIAESVTTEAVRQAKLAKEWGARGLMLLPPMRYKADDRETVTYFKTVAAATDLPVMIYNNPVDYKIEVTLDMFAELAEVPTITAVKESSRDVTNVTRMINRFGDRFSILCGVDTIAMEELLLGANGWVAGLVCAFPRETVAIYRLTKAGRIEEATKIYRWFMPLLELDIHPKLVQYIKLAEKQAGIGTEYVRAPRLTLIGEERERILTVINTALANRPQLPEYLSIAVH
ncbi:4-hydroxy-tetrahydrodipicolinate synthase [Filimonas lacunae]|uniref:4-hydroxy-tetrahydrodipicolinate synthase n=1 Tax=Filimonas lacunae TaxID=477680 RepID=A0A173MLE4_9BACT|nr:dihydrodipicolinate synthase family protein [Filimonas lacunae]BAV08300.1 1-pyrroline-4-hydroxy-2-carboxylate deaminase [Filimonas lacunae]SIT33295.1 4-hydroxy-tetrahydrodipicolinate synthase [Filimonas lacunae]